MLAFGRRWGQLHSRLCPRGKQCHEVEEGSWDVCSYPPTHLAEALSGQQRIGRDGNGFRNNEVVVDALHLKAHLPEGIAGFFYMAGTSEHDRETVKRAHARFVAQYRFPNQHAPPLMELSLQSGGTQPFRLVQTEHEWRPGEG